MFLRDHAWAPVSLQHECVAKAFSHMQKLQAYAGCVRGWACTLIAGGLPCALQLVQIRDDLLETFRNRPHTISEASEVNLTSEPLRRYA